MKLPILAASFLAGATFVQAQVPSLINYQGRLTTASGAPASGTKNFSISIYDAEAGGNVLYTEVVGPVTLDATGVYSFQFGNAGTSNTQLTETLATTDGTATSFQNILANTGVVAGSVSVTDGTYTWSQSAGSSSEDDFGVAYSSSLRRVSITYFSGAPTAGKSITAVYRFGTGGITGALSSGSQHWMAISIDGVAQTGRQRVLAVPFAMKAKEADLANAVRPTPGSFLIPSLVGSNPFNYLPFPLTVPFDSGYGKQITSGGVYVLSKQLKHFGSMKVIASSAGNTPTETAFVSVRLVEENPLTGVRTVIGDFYKSGVFDSEFLVPLNYKPDWGVNRYVVEVAVATPSDQRVARIASIRVIKIEGDE